MILIAALIVALFILTLILIPESPRFLVTQHKYNLAWKSLKWVAKINRKPSPNNLVFNS